MKSTLFLLLFCALGLQASEVKEAKVSGVHARLQQALARIADLEAQLEQLPTVQQHQTLSQNRQSQLEHFKGQERREQQRLDDKKKRSKPRKKKVKKTKGNHDEQPRKKVSSHPMGPLFYWAENCCCFCCIKPKCCRKKK